MQFRSARPDDANGVVALWRAADAAPTVTDDADSVRALLAFDPDALVVACAEDGSVVGTVIAGWDGWRGGIYRLAVVPSARRQGVARALVVEAERRLASRGAVRLAAIVEADSPAAVGFWRAVGWEQQASRLRFVRTAFGRAEGEIPP